MAHPAAAWSIDAVCTWLGGLDVTSDEIASFRRERISGKALLQLTDADLKTDLGVSLGGRKLIAKELKKLGPGGGGGAAAGSAQSATASPAGGKSDQGSRVAAGLDTFAPMGSLSALLQPQVSQDTPTFIASIEPIAAAGCIPNVIKMARVTRNSAKDQKRFGALKDDPLSEDGIAFFMKYSAEDTIPPLYKDMNNKSYNKDRAHITPFGLYIVGTVKHMKYIERYPNVEVFRGVKADLKAEYMKVLLDAHAFHALCTFMWLQMYCEHVCTLRQDSTKC